MDDIDVLMRKFCVAGKQAIHRYTEVSGEDAFDDMPEYFMPAYIFEAMGNETTFTLETRFSKLANWNEGARSRNGKSTRSHREATSVFALAESSALRVDMVIFQKYAKFTPKDQEGFLALVEFKKGRPWFADQQKLRDILHYIDTCPYGAICGFTRGDDHKNQRVIAESEGDQWFDSYADGDKYVFCARVFSR